MRGDMRDETLDFRLAPPFEYTLKDDEAILTSAWELSLSLGGDDESLMRPEKLSSSHVTLDDAYETGESSSRNCILTKSQNAARLCSGPVLLTGLI